MDLQTPAPAAAPPPPAPPEAMEPETPSSPSRTKEQILTQRRIQRPVRHQQVIVHPGSTRPLTHLLEVPIHPPAILALHILGNHLKPLLRLHIHQNRRPSQLRPNL